MWRRHKKWCLLWLSVLQLDCPGPGPLFKLCQLLVLELKTSGLEKNRYLRTELGDGIGKGVEEEKEVANKTETITRT